jgi:hypothetical protein
MKITVTLFLILAAVATTSAANTAYYDNKIPEIQDLEYMMEDEEYDSIITGVQVELMDSKTGIIAIEKLNALRIEALFKLGQYEDCNYYFKEFSIGFPEASNLFELNKFDIKAFQRRRHYYDAVISANFALRTLGGRDPGIADKVMQSTEEWIMDELNEDELIKAFNIVDKPMRAQLLVRMNRDGIEPPFNESKIIKEKWNDEVKDDDRVRGTLLGGYTFPEFESEMNVAPTGGFSIGGDAYYRVVNGFVAGIGASYNYWGHEITDAVPVNLEQGKKMPEGFFSNAIPFYIMCRVYTPQFWRFKMSLEPGVGGVVMKKWNDNPNPEEEYKAEMFLMPKVDVGFHVGDMIQIRASYKVAIDGTSIHSHWITAYAGFEIRRYK